MRVLFRRATRWLIPLCVLGAAGQARAALNCSITALPSPVKGIYVFWANLDISGSFTVTCTRNAGDPRQPWIWIGVDQPVGGASMPRDIGGSTLDYFIYRRSFGNGVWTNSGNQGANSNAAGGLRTQLDFGTSTTLTRTYNFYFRMPYLQFKPAGVYFDTPLTVTLRSGSSTGTVLNTSVLTTLISIQDNCRFSTDPGPVSLNYPAFAANPIVRSSPFALTCTQGTDYTLSLDAPQGVVPNVGIAYTAEVSAAGTQLGTATAQNHSVILTFPAGQAGRCATASCSGTDTRTITVTY